MKAQEIRENTVEEIKQQLEDLVDEMANLRIQQATHQLANSSRIHVVRKDIARIKTILKEYELNISQPKTASK